MSSSYIPIFRKIDQRKLWEIDTFIYVIECLTFRSIYSITLVFIMHALNDTIRNN